MWYLQKSVGFFLFFFNIQSVLCLSCSAPCCPALFFPCGDVPALDQSCLSTSAVNKGSRGKLFILTSFRKNKPFALGAFSPPYRSPKQRRGGPDGQQLSLCRNKYRPGSGYWHARAGASPPLRSSAVGHVRSACSTIREYKNNPTRRSVFMSQLTAVVKKKKPKTKHYANCNLEAHNKRSFRRQ